MRDRFINSLIGEAESNENLMLIVGDLGYGVIEEFEKRFPNQFINAGVAEQNMIGMAAGLAKMGYKVFVYSIANFPTFRCLEQIRNDIAYHNLDVSIVAIGAGFSYGTLGYSHHAVEDLAIMRSIPGLKIYSPCDPNKVEECFIDSLKTNGPKYFRLGKNGEPEIKNMAPIFDNSILDQTSNKLIISTGAITSEAYSAKAKLKLKGIQIDVLAVNIIKPFHLKKDQIKKYDQIYVLEEHSIIGGLGSCVIEELQAMEISIPVKLIAIPDNVEHLTGSQTFLRKHFGLDAETIANLIEESL
ncbi:MAG: transketolase C-terminal domain-containing protein [Actinomycetes bacterium]